MSSALHSVQPSQSSKQWWSKPSASKSPTGPHRLSKSATSTPTTPTTTRMAPPFDEKSLRSPSKTSSRKLNTFASVIGFKSKKNHPTISIPSGPVSPPLPLQKPPRPQASPPRPQTFSSSSSSYQPDPLSPGEPSIYTSEEAFEPITPSDHLSRHRVSYQPSLFTFAEQQDNSSGTRLCDSMGSRYMFSDARRISVMSDPSIIDPHLSREHPIRASRVSASSYYPQSDSKAFPVKLSNELLARRDSIEKRKSSGESMPGREIDLTPSDAETKTGRTRSSNLRPRDHRHSDTGIPTGPKVSVSTMQGSGLRKSPSANANIASSSGSRSNSRTSSPASSGSHDGKGTGAVGDRKDEERGGIDRMASLHNSDSPVDERPAPSSVRLSPGVRPKAASVSNGSKRGSGSAGRESVRPSIVTSFPISSMHISRSTSIASGTGGAVASIPGSMRQQPSSSRVRAVPPSRTPPPMSDLPPTPGSRSSSPLTFRSPRNASTSSLLNSAYSVASDDPSILTFDLPPSTSSSESASSVSLYFAQPRQNSAYSEMDISSTRVRNSPRSRPTTGNGYRDDLSLQRYTTQPLHGAKSSISSNHTLMNVIGVRVQTPTQHVLKKSLSQQSITVNLRGERQRVDSEASITSTAMMSEEGPPSMFGSMGKSLRKQRSMHNTRAPGGSLALPPLPQQLRHASSFNISSAFGDASGSGQSLHVKGDSYSSNMGSQRRSANSSTSASTSNSIVSTPTTPQTHKKRSLFSSHGRDRRDSNAAHAERDRQELADAQQGDRKKTHSIGLGLFSGHFTPSGSSSHILEHMHDSRRVSSPPVEDYPLLPKSPVTSVLPSNTIDQHILPPKELLSQMEALADTEAPPSPPQFADRALDGEVDDEWSWDVSSIVTTDEQSLRPRVNSVSGMSITSDGPDESGVLNKADPSSPTSMTRHFANATGSIYGRLHNDRPSTASRLPTRNFSGLSKDSTSYSSRSSTTEPLSPLRGAFPSSSTTDSYVAPTALPPPPRRKGTVVSSLSTDHVEVDKPLVVPLFPPPATHSTRLPRLPSYENTPLQRPPSHEAISTYNPNRGSTFRKPSFLNIDDDFAEASSSLGSMSSVPEDSFLILEHGKDSLDIGRASDKLSDGLIRRT